MSKLPFCLFLLSPCDNIDQQVKVGRIVHPYCKNTSCSLYSAVSMDGYKIEDIWNQAFDLAEKTGYTYMYQFIEGNHKYIIYFTVLWKKIPFLIALNRHAYTEDILRYMCVWIRNPKGASRGGVVLETESCFFLRSMLECFTLR